MNFWRKDITADVAESRAGVIIQKKKRKQDPKASGLGAVAIPRNGPRAVHQRNEDRHVLRGKTARADVGGNIHDVQLLNLSSNGVMIGCDLNLAIGEEVYLSIEECAPITTAVRWVRNGRIGLEFIAETVIIAEAGVQDFIVKTIRREVEASGYSNGLTVGTERRDASKRHPLVFVGKMRWNERQATARLRNISRTGAMIAVADATTLRDGDEVTLSLTGAGDIKAWIRWSADRQYGLQFTEEFDVSMLVNESCAELAPPDDAGGLASPSSNSGEEDFDSLRVRLGRVDNPHRAPDMEYGRLTLDEIYATLYPEGRPAKMPQQEQEQAEDTPPAAE
ncbi:PilZ domain-containing protein [Qipengyuania sphaerica]|uniref:PilZ domain-containing protein n=1 Tax=Qipengyuania sphaerica TaxID=2867243 RepID=UPI001C87B3FB|nr:PilZ domain-containing protein [Qipengyuania sphaerica]MBX7539999.1 PilZ domain-containing protein [Qipengyuania sphaerica]